MMIKRSIIVWLLFAATCYGQCPNGQCNTGPFSFGDRFFQQPQQPRQPQYQQYQQPQQRSPRDMPVSEIPAWAGDVGLSVGKITTYADGSALNIGSCVLVGRAEEGGWLVATASHLFANENLTNFVADDCLIEFKRGKGGVETVSRGKGTIVWKSMDLANNIDCTILKITWEPNVPPITFAKTGSSQYAIGFVNGTQRSIIKFEDRGAGQMYGLSPEGISGGAVLTASGEYIGIPSRVSMGDPNSRVGLLQYTTVGAVEYALAGLANKEPAPVAEANIEVPMAIPDYIGSLSVAGEGPVANVEFHGYYPQDDTVVGVFTTNTPIPQTNGLSATYMLNDRQVIVPLQWVANLGDRVVLSTKDVLLGDMQPSPHNVEVLDSQAAQYPLLRLIGGVGGRVFIRGGQVINGAGQVVGTVVNGGVGTVRWLIGGNAQQPVIRNTPILDAICPNRGGCNGDCNNCPNLVPIPDQVIPANDVVVQPGTQQEVVEDEGWSPLEKVLFFPVMILAAIGVAFVLSVIKDTV